MLRAALVAALAMLALPGTASAAQGSASPAVCAPDERAAEFDARMTRVPGTAKMISTPCEMSQGPAQPWAPNIST